MKWATFTALFVAVVTAFVGLMYLRFSGDASDSVGVVVAARDIPAGTVIEAKMVSIRSAPEANTGPNVYRDTAQVVGKVAAYKIASGEQIVPARVVSMPPWGTGLSGLPPRQSVGVGFGN